MHSISMILGLTFMLFLSYVAGQQIESNLGLKKCLPPTETPDWNRTFHFNNKGLNLRLELTDRPSHWIVNYIFLILARERLGYQNIEFVKQVWDGPASAIHRLTCPDSGCSVVPEVHVNLEVWLPLGTTPSSWAPSSKVTAHGPLGPVTRWALLSDANFSHNIKNIKKPNFVRTCDMPCEDSGHLHTNVNSSRVTNTVPCVSTNGSSASDIRDDVVRLFPCHAHLTTHVGVGTSKSTPRMTLLNWYPNSLTLPSTLPGIRIPPCNFGPNLNGSSQAPLRIHHWLMASDNGRKPYRAGDPCSHFESHQAIKLTWAKLQSTLPLIHQLVNQLRLSQSEYDELLKAAEASEDASGKGQRSFFYDIACEWVRVHPSKWKTWTEGWDQKQNLTIAGLFTFYGKWVIPYLDRVAEQAIEFVNVHPDYFLNTEYALTLNVRNLTCVQDIVLNDYFDLLTSTVGGKLIGIIAALCSDSIEPVVEVANFRRQLIVSPTVESARFVKRREHRFFFRAAPSRSQANLIMIKLFLKWGWRRVAVFRKDDHFFDPRVFQSNGIDVIADFEMKETQLTYALVKQNLERMCEHNIRIFVVEYFAKGTALVLCAAYRHGLVFDAGYVWFLNPWLSEGWWRGSYAMPAECTAEEMVNITAWTFTVGHQLLIPPMLHSFIPIYGNMQFSKEIHSETKDTRGRRSRSADYSPFKNKTSDSADTSNTSNHSHSGLSSQRKLHPPTSTYTGSRPYYSVSWARDYAVYTYESVIVLASAMVHLLRENPSAISVFESPEVAERYQRFVAETDFGYTGSKSASSSASSDPLEQWLSHDTGFQSAGEFYGTRRKGIEFASQLRFNARNERVADVWLLKQHRINVTVPVIMWYKLSDDIANKSADTDDEDQMPSFERLLERWLEDVNWGRNGGPPSDGSMTEEDCTLRVISKLFGVSCSASTAIVIATVVVPVLGLLCTLFVIYYRRKLKEAERRIRQPYEELCAELADIDIPCSEIVLNRHVGQGAFGMVYGGEAKRGGRWEAVAVKVIGAKATYEGKTDFLLEAKLMRCLDHKNVVRLIGICLHPKEDHLYLIMEFMLFGDLRTYLLSRRVIAQQYPDHEDIRPSTLTHMAIDVAEGVAYLHSKHLVHRDIACRNCLVGPDHVVKIGDFGLTRVFTRTEHEGYYRSARSCELPIRWMSPEAVQFGVFSVQSDLWSYGIVLYEIITFGVFPYDGMGDVEVVERVKRMEFSILEFLPPAAQNTTVAHLIHQCCQHQWQHRPVSMAPVIGMLRMNPECVRPFLTEEPPKPNSAIDALPFQPGAGACMMSDNALASDGPTSNNPSSAVTLTDVMSNNHGVPNTGMATFRGFHSTTGSLAGAGRASLAFCSADSFSEATTAALRMLASEGIYANNGRRRHKTADGSVGVNRSHFSRRGTSSSSGGRTCLESERSSTDRSRVELEQLRGPTFDLNPSFLEGWCAVESSSGRASVSEGNPRYRVKSTENRANKSQLIKKLIGGNQYLTRLPHQSASLENEMAEMVPMISKTSPRDNSDDKSVQNDRAHPGLLSEVDDTLHGSQLPLVQFSSSNNKPNGSLPTGVRSLSADFLTTKRNSSSTSMHPKSAPEGPISSYGGISPMKLFKKFGSHATYTNTSEDKPVTTRKDSYLARGSDVSNKVTTTRSAVGNASQLLRSMLRVFVRNGKGVSQVPGTLRTANSSASCHALASPELGCGHPRPNADVSHVSTSCPPLVVTQHSSVRSHRVGVLDENQTAESRTQPPSLPPSPIEQSPFPTTTSSAELPSVEHIGKQLTASQTSVSQPIAYRDSSNHDFLLDVESLPLRSSEQGHVLFTLPPTPPIDPPPVSRSTHDQFYPV